jgi:hypothetical protein
MASFIDFASSTNDGITVYVYGGDKHIVKLPVSATVLDLRRHCNDVCNLTLSGHDLYFSNKYLLDSMNLAQQGIHKGTTVIAKPANSAMGGGHNAMERRVSAPVMLHPPLKHIHTHTHSVSSGMHPPQAHQMQLGGPPTHQMHRQPSSTLVSPTVHRHSFSHNTQPHPQSSSSTPDRTHKAKSLSFSVPSKHHQQVRTVWSGGAVYIYICKCDVYMYM